MCKKLSKRLFYIAALLALWIFISACSTLDQPITSTIESGESEPISSTINDPSPLESNAEVQNSLPSDYKAQYQNTEATLWKQELTVHNDLPTFELQLSGNRKNFTTLSIVDSSTGEIAYHTKLDEMDFIRKDFFAVEIKDMDFDGYNDIEIFTGNGGTWKKHFIYFLWDSDEAVFIDDIYFLANLGLPCFDPEQKLVRSMEKASAYDHWYYTHQYINGKMVTIEEEDLNGVSGLFRDDMTKEKIKLLEPLYDEKNCMFIQSVRKRLDTETMEMVIVDYKFLLNDSVGAKTLKEYAPDSEVGLLLAQYETNSNIQ